MSRTNELILDIVHQLATGVGISPASTSYTMSVKEFLMHAHAMLNYELGKNVAELNLDTGSEVELRIFLKNPSFPAAGPDSKVWTLCDLLQHHHGYPVFSGSDFAAELTGRLFKANRLFVEQLKVTNDWNDVSITISAKPKDHYFLVIHPASDYFSYVFHREGSLCPLEGVIDLWDSEDKENPISIWSHDALEISKRDYDILHDLEHQTNGSKTYLDVAKSIMDTYLKGRGYVHYMDINPNSGQYREIYSVSPLQKITDTYMESFDDLRGDLKTLHRDRNYPLNMDYCELSPEEYDHLFEVATHGYVNSEAYTQAADKVVNDRLPVYQNLSRKDIFGIADSFTFWHTLYEDEDATLVQEGFLAYLVAIGQGKSVESVLNRISGSDGTYNEFEAFLKDFCQRSVKCSSASVY